MSLLGQTRQDLPFTVCSQFQPTVLEGQLCYSLNLTNLVSSETKAGKTAGLGFLVDQGVADPETQDIPGESSVSPFHLEASGSKEKSFRVYLDTLESFSGHGGGSYAMSVLKKMTGTGGFLGQSEDVKQCRIGHFEDCQAASYTREVQAQCGCLPWSLALVEPKASNFCSPSSSSCYTRVASEISQGCRLSCTGLYADTQDNLADKLDSGGVL